MHRHRQQPTKRSPAATLANNHSPGATDYHVAVTTGAVEGGGVETVDEHRAGHRAGNRATAGGFVCHAGGGENTSGEQKRSGLVPWPGNGHAVGSVTRAAGFPLKSKLLAHEL